MPRRKNSKAAWRALDDDVARTARAGPTAAETAATLSNDALFYVDTAAAAGTLNSGSSGGSKRARARARALKIDAAKGDAANGASAAIRSELLTHPADPKSAATIPPPLRVDVALATVVSSVRAHNRRAVVDIMIVVVVAVCGKDKNSL